APSGGAPQPADHRGEGQVNQIRDLAECAWPAVLGAAGSPFRSASWCAALAVVLDRCAGDLGRVRRLGGARFESAVRRELPRWGVQRPCLRIIRAVLPHWVTQPVWTRTAWAPWNAPTWRSVIGAIPAPAWPIPRPGWSPSWTTSAWPPW